MIFLRDEMVPWEMEPWRYGVIDEDAHEDWYFNMGNTADEISLRLFGA